MNTDKELLDEAVALLVRTLEIADWKTWAKEDAERTVDEFFHVLGLQAASIENFLAKIKTGSGEEGS